jgi:hypothetical protein
MNHLNKYFLIVALGFSCLLSLSTRAQAPAEESIATKELVKSPEFFEMKPAAYQALEEMWKRTTEEQPSDANAWLNYYKSARFSNYTEHAKNIGKDEKKKLDAIISKMSVEVPSTFAFYYASYLHAEKSDESFSYLKAAYNLDPSNAELYDDLLCNALINGPVNEVKTFSEKLSAIGIYNAAEVEYNRNVFNSVEQNAILVTNGNVDTYPLILMQQLQGFRTDVSVVCLDWLNSQKYREKVALQLGIAPKGLDFDRILNASASRPVYVALTLPPSLLKKFSNEFYCTGLAMKHSFSPLKNLESLAYNWEFLFVKTKLNSAEQINRNYLLPLIQLREHYNTQGRGGDAAKIDQQIRDLSQRFGLTSAIQKHLD